MNEDSMRESLLRQKATASVEAELAVLRQLVESENRRSRRLTRWVVAVWCVWFLSVFLMFALPMLAYRPAGAAPAAPAAQAAQEEGLLIKTLQALVLAGVVAMLVSVVVLPFVGIVLLVLQFFARRSATFAQLRASVAGIDAQLKLLGGARDGGPSQAGP